MTASKRTLIWLLMMIVAVSLLTGCANTKYVPVEKVRIEKETEHDTVTIKDSTARNDSTTIKTDMLLQKVDSAYLAMLGIINAPKEAWLLQKNTTTEHNSSETVNHQEEHKQYSDTVKTEYIEVPYPVEKKLSWWDSIKVNYSVPLILVLVVVILVLIIGKNINRLLKR